MPSFLHEILVQMFRTRPQLARELLRVCEGIELDGDAEIGSVDLSQVASPEYRADAVVVLRDEARVATSAVVVEIQLGIDADKRRTWPVYITVLRASLGCPVTLLVLAEDAGVARWARHAIELGHPGFVLRPIAIAYSDIPRITDAALARESPELAVLSAIAHPDVDVARAALATFRDLPEDMRKLYSNVVLIALPQLVRQVLEAEMKDFTLDPEFGKFTQSLIDQGHERGREKGREEAREEAREERRKQGRKLVLALAKSKLGSIDEQLAARVNAVNDTALLDELCVAIGSTRDASEALGVLDRLVPSHSV